MAQGHPLRGLPAASRRAAERRAESWLLLGAAMLGLGVVPVAGCKSGASFTKPSWPTFGGLPKKEPADGLASAPPYSGDPKKPSETAKPYPTTSTPNGYVLSGSTSPSGPSQVQTPQSQAAVVYGSPPPTAAPTQSPAAAVAGISPGVPGAAGSSGIGPQVGPYSGSPADSIPPPGQPLPPIAPSSSATVAAAASGTVAGGIAPAEAALPGSPYPLPGGQPQPFGTAASEPPARMADARSVDASAAAAALPLQPPAMAAPMAPPAGAAVGSRYADSAPSRFATGGSATPPAAGGLMQPEPAVPQASPAGYPAAPPASLPAATPGLLQPGAPPVRRPDPGYRPGGTSNYRPSRTILADDPADGGPAVRTASFDEAAAEPRRQ